MEVFRDIAYYEVPGTDPKGLSLDIYTPCSEECTCPRPVMIYVHGGGWTRGDKSAVAEKPQFFTEEGFIFISTNYRMTPEVEFPIHVEDVARAIGWVHANISEYGGDPQQIFLMGHSAGAHLVSLVATDGQYLRRFGLSLDALSGVISNDTQAYDIPWQAQQQGGQLRAAYADTFGQDPDCWALFSPLTHVEPNKGIPPMLLLVSRGMSSLWINPQRLMATQAFAEALDAASIPVKIINIPQKTHGQINQQIGEPGDAETQEILEFLENLLRR